MLADMEYYSKFSGFKIDPKNLLSEKIEWKKSVGKVEETIYNILVAESLRGTVFNEIGDLVNLCI